MCSRMRGEHVFKKFESKLRTNGRTNERTNICHGCKWTNQHASAYIWNRTYKYAGSHRSWRIRLRIFRSWTKSGRIFLTKNNTKKSSTPHVLSWPKPRYERWACVKSRSRTTHERTDERMRTNGLTYERTNELWMKMSLCANERMMDERMDERMNEWLMMM